MSKDKILQPLGLVAGPLSWSSAIGLPPKPSAHQRRVPEQEAQMLVVVIVSVVKWCAGGMVGRSGRDVGGRGSGSGGPDPARWRPSPRAVDSTCMEKMEWQSRYQEREPLR